MNRPKSLRLKPMLLMMAMSAFATMPVSAQLEKETFYPGGLAYTTADDGVQLLTTPALRVQQLVDQHIVNHQSGRPLRFAEAFLLGRSASEVGTWTTEANGDEVWRLRIETPEAKSINLGFSKYRMPVGGNLVISSGDKSQSIRPFTADDNDDHGELWTPIIDGDNVLIEARVPAGKRASLQLELQAINAAFVDFNDPFAGVRSGACNVDVVCPEGDNWRDEIKSVGAWTLSGVDQCSGALVNNARNDGTPFFLTANHCISNPALAASVVVYWNFENSTCRVPGSPASGGPGDGVRTQFNSGAILRANRSASDFSLLELDDPINPDHDLFWSGIDATGATPNSTVAIHHPGVDEKRISFENDPLTISAYLGAPGSGTTHWRVFDWDLGTTEGGSSGSPIYSPHPDRRIIGQLHGGFAACGNDLEDWYGRVSVSWAEGGTAPTQLRSWLDPDNTGTLVIDGRGTAPYTLSVDPAAVGVCSTVGSVGIDIDIGVSEPGFNDPVDLAFSGLPTGATGSFSVDPVTPPGSSVLTVGGLASATPGSYSVSISASSGDNELTRVVPFNLSAGNPGATTLTAPANGATGLGSSVTLSWSGASGALSYQVEVAEDPGFVTVIFDEIIEGTSTTLAGLDGATTYYWRVTASNDCGDGTTSAVFNFRTATAPGQCDEGVEPNVLFSEDFTGGLGGFTTTGSSGSSTWAISTARPSPASGGNGVLAVNLTTVSHQFLISPAITLPSDGLPLSLQFQNDQTIEDQSATACFDGALLDISTNGGSTWTQLPSSAMLTRPYDGPISTAWSSPAGGQQAWCGDPRTWENQVVDLNAYAGQTVHFRWRMATDSSVGRAPHGWYVDDIAVQSCGDAPTEGINLGITLAASPEPVTVGSELTYTVNVANTGPEDATDVEVELTLPADIGYVSGVAVGTSKATSTVRGSDWTCAEDAGTVLCGLAGSVASGGAAPTLTVTALVAADATPGVVTTTATVSGAETELAPSNNSASVDTTIEGLPDAIFCDGFEEGGDGSCGGGGPVDPDLVIIDDLNWTPAADFTGGSIKWVDGETCVCDTAPYNFNPYGTASTLQFFWPLNANGSEGGVTLNGSAYAVLQSGATIGASSQFLVGTGAALTAPWANTTGYLGFRFLDGGITKYGYAHITVGANGRPFTLNSITYNNVGASVTIP